MISNRSVLDWPTGTTVFKPDKCYNGYTVVTPYRSQLIFLIDMAGRVVHTWSADPDRPAQSWFVRRLPNGNWMSPNYCIGLPDPALPADLIPSSSSSMDFRAELVELNWHGEVVWRYRPPHGTYLNHDMARLENGNTLVNLEKRGQALSISDKPISDYFFAEVEPSGRFVWEWHAIDHFDEFGFSEEAKQLMYQEGGKFLLSNTVSPLPGNALEKSDARFAKGNILTSQRETSLIYIIDKSTGNVVWTWGTGKGQLVGQHHPVMLHNGNILIYDNGGKSGYPLKVRFYTRLIEINPLTKKIVWEYAYEPYTFKPTSKFFSSTWGSVQRLPNGNTLSLDCHKGRLFEVSPWGEIVWEYISPFAWGRGTQVLDSGVYRAYRYGYDEVPEPDAYFKNTDGHMDCQPDARSLPEYLGLPGRLRCEHRAWRGVFGGTSTCSNLAFKRYHRMTSISFTIRLWRFSGILERG